VTEVRVFDIDGDLMGMPEGGWLGTAQDCGDGKMLITFAGTSGKFWADDQTWDHDLYGYRRWYRTPAQLVNENHRYEVLQALKDQGIVWGPAEWDLHRTVPVTELETLLKGD
jgi:hypothetical protein